jgi:IS30 family transposase
LQHLVELKGWFDEEVVVGRRWKYLPEDKRREIIRLAAGGRPVEEIRTLVGVAEGTVRKVMRPLGGVLRPEMWAPSSARLSLEDRVQVRLRLEAGWSFRAIAAELGRSPSTISREVNASGGKGSYQPVKAHRDACGRARRPKPTKLARNPQLCAVVTRDLERLWSPQQIAVRLREAFPDDPEMWVSHETIYKTLYVQGRGKLRRELAACLRTGRAVRRPQGRESKARIPGMVMISERPAEADDRAVPGHWEGDLIMGKDSRSAIGTLVERSTRFVMLLHLAGGKTAEDVQTAMTRAITELPKALRRSITWDQGTEMARHAEFTVDTGVPVYFCDPHSPWQRGSNENTNGLLRQYFPKGTDLSVHAPEDLQAAADSLNGRPRMTLNWMTPSEKLNQILVALTD